MNKKLSVIIPAYNEEKRIEKTLLDVQNYLGKQPYDYEIVVVDNHSNDHTVDVVKKLQETSIKTLRVLEQQVRGKGAAVKKGILEAQGDYVIFMDADNATPISEIEKFWPYLQQGYEVVIGSRYVDPSTVKVQQAFYKVFLSRMSNLLIQVLLIPHIKDTQAGFKAFQGESAKKIFQNVTIFGWGFDMEVLAIALKLSYRIKEIPVLWEEHGGSHVPLSAYITSLMNLFTIKWNSIIGKYSAN